MSNIDIDTNEDHFEQVWRDKGIILRCDACLQPLNTQTVRGCLMDVSNSTSAPTRTCTHMYNQHRRNALYCVAIFI